MVKQFDVEKARNAGWSCSCLLLQKTMLLFLAFTVGLVLVGLKSLQPMSLPKTEEKRVSQYANYTGTHKSYHAPFINDEHQVTQERTFRLGSPVPSQSSFGGRSSIIENEAKDYNLLSCDFMPTPKETNGQPMLLSSYSGSGGGITNSFIRALTGLGGDILDDNSCRKKTSATCMTSWPVTSHALDPSQAGFYEGTRATVLVRNPKDIVLSSFQRYWDSSISEDGGSDPHSIEPGLVWYQWRDEYFIQEVEKWKRMILHWYTSRDYHVVMTLSYESLTNTRKGPRELVRLAKELQRNGFNVSGDDNMICLWNKVINSEQNALSCKFTSEAIFTSGQQEHLLQLLEELQTHVEHDVSIVQLIDLYHEDITIKFPTDKSDDSVKPN
jgi:hypothetical protein